MATIIKRKKSYSVVYNYINENGETKQKWETWHTHKEALKRKAEIENQQNNGTFLPAKPVGHWILVAIAIYCASVSISDWRANFFLNGQWKEAPPE